MNIIWVLKYILLFIVLFVVEAEIVGAKDVARSPEPALSPKEVVQIQLNALKNEDQNVWRRGSENELTIESEDDSNQTFGKSTF